MTNELVNGAFKKKKKPIVFVQEYHYFFHSCIFLLIIQNIFFLKIPNYICQYIFCMIQIPYFTINMVWTMDETEHVWTIVK